jgi:hypothetical protein
VLRQETEETTSNLPNPWQVAMNNFFALLRDLRMKNVETGSERNSTKTGGTNESTGKGRPSLIVLTSEANLINLQRELKTVMNGEFFFWNTAVGSWLTTKRMVDYNTIQKFLTKKNLHFVTFYTKVDKLVKTIIKNFFGSPSV